MNLGHDWHRLQQVADHRMARKTLRTGAIGSVIVGSLSLILGFMPPMDPIACAVGAVLLGTGLWNITRPQPAGIVIDGLTLILVGAYNILGAFGGGGAGLWVKLGAFQLYWGVQGIMRYTRFRGAFAFAPQDAEVRQLDEMVRSIEKAKVKESTDTIEFTTTGLHARLWRGRLTDTGALLVTIGSHEALVVGKHEFDVEPGGKVVLGNNLKATFTIKGKAYKGSISPQSLERFQSWKMGTSIPLAIAA